MKKFMVLYMAPSTAFEKWMKESTPETQQASMSAWMKWITEHQAAIVDHGNPLGKTTRVDGKGAAPIKNEIGGYMIVQGDSAEAVAKMFGKDHPHLQMAEGWVEIMEIIPMGGT